MFIWFYLMGFIRRSSLRETMLATPVSLFLFIWAQVISLDNLFFLFFLFLSLFFLGVATLQLAFTDTRHASKRAKQLFQMMLLVTIIVSVIGATSIAAFSRGGTRHNVSLRPDDFDRVLNYGSWASGYYVRQDWTIYEADYAIGAVFADYFLDFVNIFVNKSVNLNGHIWVDFSLLPNHQMADTIFKASEGTFVLNGTEAGAILNPNHWLTVHWGSFDTAYRARIDKGYTVTLIITLQLEGTNQGDLRVTIPLHGETYQMLRIDDVEVTSQFQDNVVILISGIFVGIQIQTLAKSAKDFSQAKQPEATRSTMQPVSS